MDTWKWLAVAAAAAALLWLLDRLLLGLERDGYIYYRRSGDRRASVGNAFLELQQMVQPQVRHVIEAREERRQQSPIGSDPPPDTTDP